MVLLLVSLFKIVSIIEDDIEADLEFEELAELVDNEEQLAEGTLPANSAAPMDTDSKILPQYRELYQENPDLAGWVQIEGTNLDYPVMYTPDDQEFYLRRAFDQSYSVSGTPFMGQGSSLDPQSDNLILYGHNISSKTMFAALLNYKNETFWREHPCIRFDTLFQAGEYEVLSAFPIDVTPGNGHFQFYKYVDFDTVDERQDFIACCKQLSLYETGVSVEESDHLITLVTCSHHVKNGRFVVVAREKNNGESFQTP